MSRTATASPGSTMRRPPAARSRLHAAARRATGLILALGLVHAASPLAGQGSGSAGVELLQMTAGTRAAGFAGAYAAARGDSDAIFYNPAAVGWLSAAVGLGYQAYVEDITFGTASGAYDLGPVVLGAGLVFLDAGSIEEVVPDGDFGGERGEPTGQTVGATEAAARITAALRMLGDRATVGASVGVVTSDLAGVSRAGPFVDVGAQYRLRQLTIGASARNIGPALSGDDGMGDTPLPSEVRLGATYDLALGSTYGLTASADGVYGLKEEVLGLALGGEAGLRPQDGSFAAVLRAGVTLVEGEAHLGRLRIGGGVALGGLAVDYALQTFEYLGTIHRFGVRWTR